MSTRGPEAGRPRDAVADPGVSNEKAPEPLIDLQRLVVSVRRRRRTWLGFMLAGLIAGCLVAVLLPTPPTAVAKVLVVHADDSPTDSGTLMRTDVALLHTTRIATAALKLLNSDEPPEEFLKNYEGLGLTNNILQITVKGQDDADAVARAQALSDAFIADHVQRSQASAAAEAKALIDQRDQARTDLAAVDTSIAKLEALGRNANATELETLYSRRAELASKVSDFDGRAQTAGIGTPRIAAGTQIVDAPRAKPRSLLKTLATNGGIGLALGLVAGLALAAIGSIVGDRPVLRREISAHLGASVIAQLPKPPRGPAVVWRRSRATAERRRVATTLARAVRTDPRPVSLLDLGAPHTTGALAVDIAAELEPTGPVLIIDSLPRANIRKLTAGSEIEVTDRADEVPGSGPYRIGVGSVDAGASWLDLGRLGEEAVLVVRTGYANAAWLHTVARQLAERQIPIIGVVVVDPDPRDHSDGTLWEGLRTALRGRAGRPAHLAWPAGEPDAEPERKPQPVPRLKPVKSDNADLPTMRFAPIRTERKSDDEGASPDAEAL